MSASAYILRTGALGALAMTASLLAGACNADVAVPSGEAHLEATRSALVDDAQQIMGTNNGDKVLILTFDDGPGPMEVTGDLSGWLREQGIQATFFVNGACIKETDLDNNSACDYPVDGAYEVMRKVVADGHLIGNHTTTHRSLTGENEGAQIPRSQWIRDIQETDDDIKSLVPWNRFLFRAPYGDYSASVNDVLSDSALSKYNGPVYWNAGGGPTDRTRAADWECWDPNAGLHYTTKKCGDLYLKEIRSLGNGIVLMHEAKGNTDNHALTSGVGNTADMVKYIVPILKSEGYTFKPLWEDADLAPMLPRCDGTCAECSGPSATECTKCPDGKYVSGGRCVTCSTCKSGVQTACNGVTDTACIGGSVNAVSESITGGALGNQSSTTPSPASQPTTVTEQAGCNAGSSSSGSFATLGLALGALSLLRRRRR